MSKKLLIASLGFIGLLVAQNAYASISFDASSTWVSGSNSSSVTVPMTVGTGVNEMLFVYAYTTLANPTATWNGIPMTAIGTNYPVDIGRAMTLFALPSAQTGTYNVVVGATSSEAVIQAGAVSYFGVKQSTLLDATTTNSTTSAVTVFNTSLTTTQNGDWVIMAGRTGANTILAGSNSRLVVTSSAQSAILDNNGPISPQLYTMGFDLSAASSAYAIMGAFSPAIIPSPDVTSTILTVSGALNVKGALTVN